MMTMNQAWEKLNEEKVARFVFYLFERWQDEWRYEDLNDYLEAVKKSFPGAYKMTSRPFGFSVKCSDGKLRVVVKCSETAYHFEGEMSVA